MRRRPERRNLAAALAVLVFATAASAAAQSDNREDGCERGQPVELVDCYDGDTCSFQGLEESVRFADIDAPEMDGECAEAARETRRQLLSALRVANRICVDIRERGFYGRYIADVYADGHNLNNWLLENTSAVEYGEETCLARSNDARGQGERERDSDDGGSDGVRCDGSVNCGDLNSCAEARRHLEECEGDPNGLDGDGDGTPCESLCGG